MTKIQKSKMIFLIISALFLTSSVFSANLCGQALGAYPILASEDALAINIFSEEVGRPPLKNLNVVLKKIRVCPEFFSTMASKHGRKIRENSLQKTMKSRKTAFWAIFKTARTFTKEERRWLLLNTHRDLARKERQPLAEALVNPAAPSRAPENFVTPVPEYGYESETSSIFLGTSDDESDRLPRFIYVGRPGNTLVLERSIARQVGTENFIYFVPLPRGGRTFASDYLLRLHELLDRDGFKAWHIDLLLPPELVVRGQEESVDQENGYFVFSWGNFFGSSDD